MTIEQYKKSIAAAKSRDHGLTFEEQITASLEWYESRGLMKVKKTPEPMKPIGKPISPGRFIAVYTEAAQVDFAGTLRGGRSIRFEAKQTDTDRFQRRRLNDDQMDDLRGNQQLGALCFVLLCFGYDHFYRVPWRVWDNMKQFFGRQYVTEKDLKQFRLPYIAGVIKILDGLTGCIGKNIEHVIFDELHTKEETP